MDLAIDSGQLLANLSSVKHSMICFKNGFQSKINFGKNCMPFFFFKFDKIRQSLKSSGGNIPINHYIIQFFSNLSS